ncbi:MAG: metal ABC transporter permease [Cryomorphaceae bacterium]|nr:metal ABC transporter permease [Cryomorphaceae bacterium]
MNIWVLIHAIIISLSCSLAGAFLVLRHRAMLADAISHAVLPGLVIAFLITGSRNTPGMLAGAIAFGFLCIFLVEFFKRKVKVTDDASIGITFTSLFAFGIILVSKYAEQVDLDQECVLHGEITFSALQRMHFPFTQWMVPNTFVTSVFTLLAVVLVLLAGYRGLFITSFHPEYASSIGISIGFWHYLSSGVASMVTIVSFEAVGAILVIALMVIPSATAWLISRRLPEMLWKTTMFAITGSVAGFYLAIWLNVSIAGTIAAVLGVQFAMVLILKGSFRHRSIH